MLTRRAQAAPVRYGFGPAQAQLGFAVAVFGLFDIPGRFERFQGELLLDLTHSWADPWAGPWAAPERTRLTVEMDMASARMADADHTARLRGPDFFDTAQFPRARFTSQSARRVAADRLSLEGLLEMRGQMRPLAVDLRLGDRRRGEAGDSLGLEAASRLSRSAYGMMADRALLGDAVRLSLSLRVAAPPG
ncbi:YceI family protein [Roseomonas sp. 18066]|uniref:YceI family protein n=1 Tax=Roseomonas sp. 18066 TaxID=2681412 RepID=UPI00135A1624|nr:YceI family protein [Roseomonas sp. 18066]